LKLRSWLAIVILIIGVIATSACINPTNNIGVTINTNGTSDTTHVNFNPSIPFGNPPVQMENEIKNKALNDVDDYNSTVDSIKNDISAIAQKYNYTASVTIVSQFGTDQLPMPAQVSGTSMVPTLQDGQSIMVLKTKDFKVNDLVVAYDPEYGLIVKRLAIINGDQVYLAADNKNVETSTVQLGNGEVETITKTPLSTWLPRDDVIGVVKVY
jgi:signal peptidase I